MESESGDDFFGKGVPDVDHSVFEGVLSVVQSADNSLLFVCVSPCSSVPGQTQQPLVKGSTTNVPLNYFGIGHNFSKHFAMQMLMHTSSYASLVCQQLKKNGNQ